jgi:curved DNA-binding protein CbpA
MKIIEAYEVLSDEQARKNYDINNLRSHGNKSRWTPPADFSTVYSYDQIKRRYKPSNIEGGMWDISDKASFGMWKATMLLFACLAAIVLYILIQS